ncbi:MAG: MerR family DNA-binding transcriptional regulator, partial [Muribaculaceae bacterium]
MDNNDLNKKFYKISDVAAILGIPASTLRFWEKEFTIIKPRRN